MPFHALEHVAQHEQMPGFRGRFVHGRSLSRFLDVFQPVREDYRV
jgi:hypothetical protein